MYSKISARAACRVRYRFRRTRSVLSYEKKLSTAELSHTLPDRLMLQVTRARPTGAERIHSCTGWIQSVVAIPHRHGGVR
jgi:hypothetical protein